MACTTFFDSDISPSRSTRSSGSGATPFTGSKPPGSSSPVSALEQRAVPRVGEANQAEVLHAAQGTGGVLPAILHAFMSKKTKKRKLRARRNKANHGKRPNAGRRS